MRIWLLKDGENLPIQENVSKMRTWMLAEALAQRGHQVTWWSSTHSHQKKELLSTTDLNIDVAPGIGLKLLYCGAYSNNRSFARYAHHRRLAARFLQMSEFEEPPDLIVASFPTIDLAQAGVTAAKRSNCKSVVDIRDPWPDVAYNLYDGLSRLIVKTLLSSMQRRARVCLEQADILYACSDGFLNWGLGKAGRRRRSLDQVFFIGRPKAGTEVVTDDLEIGAFLPDDKVIVSFLGSFGHVYELELVCQAARLLQREGDTRFQFILAGDGDKGPRIQTIAADLPNVTLTGWLRQSDAEILINRSTLGLAPYRQLPGCLPNKIFEYLASGLPIISSLQGDMPALLEEFDAGYSYNAGDADELVACLKAASESRERLESLRKGATSLFNSKCIAAKIYQEYAASLETSIEEE